MAIFDVNSDPFDDEGIAKHIEAALKVTPSNGRVQDNLYKLIKYAFNPTLIHAENIPKQPCLFIGNHSLFAFDGFVLGPTMLNEEGRFLRGLGDKFLFSSSTGDQVLKLGGVLGHPKVCAALMEKGEDLLVFPGGAHEATKTAAQKYELQWKERFGFVKLAALHGYTIMPFAMVGPDEFYNHLIEGEQIPDTAVGRLLTRLGLLTDSTRPDMLPPIPIGAWGTLFPKPQRCYMQFGEPVDLSKHKGKKPTQKQLQTIRGGVAEQIEDMISNLLLLRTQQKGKDGFIRRLLNV